MTLMSVGWPTPPTAGWLADEVRERAVASAVRAVPGRHVAVCTFGKFRN